MEQQIVYDLAEKHDSSLDLIEKIMAENDLVYELTENDIWPSGLDSPSDPHLIRKMGFR